MSPDPGSSPGCLKGPPVPGGGAELNYHVPVVVHGQAEGVLPPGLLAVVLLDAPQVLLPNLPADSLSLLPRGRAARGQEQPLQEYQRGHVGCRPLWSWPQHVLQGLRSGGAGPVRTYPGVLLGVEALPAFPRLLQGKIQRRAAAQQGQQQPQHHRHGLGGKESGLGVVQGRAPPPITPWPGQAESLQVWIKAEGEEEKCKQSG